MKVFVTGASGAIGRPLVAALAAAQHEVVGMTSRSEGVKLLGERGAEGVVLDALDGGAFSAAMAKIRPDAIIDELTSLPRGYTPEEMRKAAPRDCQIRLEGGGHLHRSALESGVKRYIVQSTAFFYRTGKGSQRRRTRWRATQRPASPAAWPPTCSKRVLGSRGMDGVALRYGFFYGPGTYHDPQSGSISEQLRRREYPVIDPGTAISSFIHVEDAAAATVAALEILPGAYNIVDDHPVALAVWLPPFARFIGAPAPPHISQKEALQADGPVAIYYATQLRGASNQKARKEFGFAPRLQEKR